METPMPHPRQKHVQNQLLHLISNMDAEKQRRKGDIKYEYEASDHNRTSSGYFHIPGQIKPKFRLLIISKGVFWMTINVFIFFNNDGFVGGGGQAREDI